MVVSIAIVGRTNVGKSSLFRVITSHIRHAGNLGRKSHLENLIMPIVSEREHTTRDAISFDSLIESRECRISDTAGFEDNKSQSDEIKLASIASTIELIKSANIVIFVVDINLLHEEDKIFARLIRKQFSGNTIIFVANKCDNDSSSILRTEFCQLGFGNPMTISSMHKSGIDNLYKRLVSEIKNFEKSDCKEQISAENTIETKTINIALYGKQNAGKSTLFNVMCGKDRAIVSDIPGTTIDCISETIPFQQYSLRIVDTAGQARTAKDSYERYSQFHSSQTADEVDIIVFVVDLQEETEWMEGRRPKLSNYVRSMMQKLEKSYKPILICFNKRDLVKEFAIKMISSELRNQSYEFISAKTGKIRGLLERIVRMYEALSTKISTKKLNTWLKAIAITDSNHIKIKFITQTEVNPMTITLFVKEKVPEEQLRFLKSCLRKDFNLPAIPIKLVVKTYEKETRAPLIK